MNSGVKKLISNHLIIIITLIGLILRIGNPTYASPILYAMSDEASNYMSALYMISERTLITKAAVYPPLGAYIQAPFLLFSFAVLIMTRTFRSVPDLYFFLVTHEGFFLFIPRLISGLLGTLTIPVVYLIAKEIFPHNKKIILWSAFLFALSFNHLHVSHFNRPWSGLVLFYALTILFSLKCITNKKKQLKNYLLAGLFSGLSFGFHYAGLFAFISFLLIVLPWSFSKMRKDLLRLKIIFSSLIFVSLVFMFYSLIENKVGIDSFAPALASYNQESVLNLTIRLIKNISLVPLLKQLFVIDPVITFFGVSALFLKKLWKKPFAGLSLFTVFYLLMASLFIHVSARYLMPLMIIFSLFSAYFIDRLLSKINFYYFKNLTLLLIITVLMINPLVWNYLYFKKPTFIIAREWIDKNIPKTIPIGSTSYRMVGYSPSKSAIAAIQKSHPGYYSKLKAVLDKTESNDIDNVRNIYYLEQITNIYDVEEIKKTLRLYQIEYLVDYYWNPQDKIVNKLKETQLIKHFSPVKEGLTPIPISNLTFHILDPNNNNFLFSVNKPGSYIDVLRVTLE